MGNRSAATAAVCGVPVGGKSHQARGLAWLVFLLAFVSLAGACQRSGYEKGVLHATVPNGGQVHFVDHGARITIEVSSPARDALVARADADRRALGAVAPADYLIVKVDNRHGSHGAPLDMDPGVGVRTASGQVAAAVSMPVFLVQATASMSDHYQGFDMAAHYARGVKAGERATLLFAVLGAGTSDADFSHQWARVNPTDSVVEVWWQSGLAESPRKLGTG